MLAFNTFVRSVILALASAPRFALGAYLLIVVVLCLWPFNFSPRNEAMVLPGNGLRFTPPSNSFTVSPPEKLAALGRFTIFVELTPGPPAENQPGRVVTYGWDFWHQNFEIDQHGSYFVFARNYDGLLISAGFSYEPDRRFRLAVVADTSLTLYVDGVRKSSVPLLNSFTTGWDATAPLIFGSEGNGQSCWTGTVHSLSIIPRSLSAEEVLDPQRAFGTLKPILSYEFSTAQGNMIPDRGTGDGSPLVITQGYKPPRKEVLLSPALYWAHKKLYVRDIIMNIILYSPIGFLLGTVFRGSRRSQLGSLAAIMAAGCFLSLSIELAQVLLPSRNSSGMDIITNCIGTLVGYWVFRAYGINRMPADPMSVTRG